jgi:ATP-binding cassette subfamily B protein
MSKAITDVESIRGFVHMGIVRTPYYVALFVGVAVLILRLDWRLGLLSAVFMPIVAVLSGIARVHLRRIWLRIQEEMAELSTVLQENLTGVRVVKAFASEEYEEAKFDEKNRVVASDLVRAARIDALSGNFMMLSLLAAMGLILWYGGSRVISGHITAGELAQFLFYMQILSIPVRTTGQLVSTYAKAMTAGGRMFEVLDARSPVREAPAAREMPRVDGNVRFDGVSFSYDGVAGVLKDISLEARPGERVALLGAPGSGKTTLVHLMPRFYDVGSGQVTIDGTDIRDVTLKSLRRAIGLVQQDVFLFTASIRDNIAYGRPDASMDEVVEAARIAQLDEFIRTLEDGYDTKIGERGVTLSGGQRQRLSIARAVILDPPILILDDSTSSVDAHTEELIRQAMESVMRGRTSFVIAHRLSTVHRADQILVLRDGEITERGNHQELLANGALYREIYDLQLRPQEDVMMEFEVPAAGDGASS